MKSLNKELQHITLITQDFQEMLEVCDAVYIRSLPKNHYNQIKIALEMGKHVLCESPVTLCKKQSQELYEMARRNNLIIMEAIKTAYSTAYSRLRLLIKGGLIGEVVAVESTCTSLKVYEGTERTDWNGIYEWGPTALLPIFHILGTDCKDYKISYDNRFGQIQ